MKVIKNFLKYYKLKEIFKLKNNKDIANYVYKPIKTKLNQIPFKGIAYATILST